MRLVPKDNAAKIGFFKRHIESWLENASILGTSTEAVDDLAAKTQIAFDAYRKQKALQQSAQAATLELNLAIEAMGTAGAAIIKHIRATADVNGNSIYSVANIPTPADASPIAPPGEPTQFKASIEQVGILTLTWKCKNPKGSTGTMYQVWRSVDNGERVFLGQTGEKKYVDISIPPGTASITYEVQAMRSTAVGAIGQYMLRFGVTEGMRRMILQSRRINSAA